MSYWNDAKQPPKKLTQCLFKGGKYSVAEGIWWEGDGAKPPGFYVQAGENFFHAPWAEVWMPMPQPLNDPGERPALETPAQRSQ